ncbi:dethiobiotin synthase [Limisphaera sp. VF-2]|jgi:dethiobiotin synthetase|uniref:dethiobiotin synthase n=1 Tax=Limisphaera sp. VF-2 TaxID=3400418 RepID=UPI0017689D7E|nr:dethiobiotin synthase [Limisphaera sp.]
MWLYITGTDTGVGKTVLATAWVRHLRGTGLRVIGLKPVCSGGRTDARRLWEASGRALPLDRVNPWWYRAAVAPVVAARRLGQSLQREQVVEHVRQVAQGFEVVVVEGAGGWLSPIGEDFDNRDLLRALGAVPVVVAPNRLGVVNQVRLVWEALGSRWTQKAVGVLMDPAKPHPLTRLNRELLAAYLEPARLIRFPWLPEAMVAGETPLSRRARAALDALGRQVGIRSAR